MTLKLTNLYFSDQIMAKLEQDNKFLADLEKQRKAAKASHHHPTNGGHSDTSNPSSNNHSPTSLPRTNSAITDSGFLSQSSLSSPGSRLLQTSSSSTGSLNKLPGVSGADKINLLNGGSYKATGSLDKVVPSNSNQSKGVVNGLTFMEKDGSIEVPGKGWCFVYIARYSYDPFQHSPNESPEAELQVNAGDYILVWGDVDEDGFYDGELLDGRRGLVPSNFVEKLEGEELFDFHQQVVLGLGDCDDSVCTSIPQDLDFMSADEGMEPDSKPIRKSSQPLPVANNDFSKSWATLPQYASCTDLDMTEDDDDQELGLKGGQVPCPRHLTFEPQQNRSVVIAWSPPEIKAHLICSYQVIVDSTLYTAVKGTLKTTINNLDLSYIHRISVKSVTKDNKVSNEAGCTMVIGKDAPMRPTSVKATKVSSTSATISWIPSNTNFMHAIIVNNCEVKTVKQGVFKHSIAGLSPNTTYKVKVRAKNLKAATYLSNNYQLSSGILEVTTKPKGLPEPPLDLQVLKGPREGTITVTWLPVTINPLGTSNGAPVLGYNIYADGQEVHEVSSGTADQAIVEIKPSASTISMRTKTSNDDLSAESECCKIPISVKAGLMRTNSFSASKSDDEDNGGLLRSSSNSTSAPVSQQREMLINYSSGYPELDSDIGPSELSDIAEEPEEGLTSEDGTEDGSRGSTPKVPEKTTTSNGMSSSNSNIAISTTASSITRWSSNSLYTSSNTSSQQQPSNTIGLSNNNNSFSTSSTTSSNNTSISSIASSTTKVQINGGTTTTTISKQQAKLKIRIFVALFDYDPPTMSPNPDACDEELPFREGQLIKVYGDKDAGTYYKILADFFDNFSLTLLLTSF